MSKDRFANIADDYELWKLIDDQYDLVHRRVIELVKEEVGRNSLPDYSTLEVGSGTGYTTAMLLEADPRIRVAAIDKSLDMTQKASCCLAEKGFRPPRVVFGSFDICDMSSRLANFFDLAVTVFTIHNIEPNRRQTAISVIHTYLRQGALFVTGDQLPPDDRNEADKLYHGWLDDIVIFKERKLEKSYDFWRAHTIEDSERRLTEGAQVKMLEAAGFEEITLHERFGIYRIVTARKPK